MKPMLAATTDGTNLTYPLIASPKIDGVRALVKGGILFSRALKIIPNVHTQGLFGYPKFNGFDGELVVGKPNDLNCYRNTTSGVMSRDGEPRVVFYIFDHIGYADFKYRVRMERLKYAFERCKGSAHVKLLQTKKIRDEAELLEYERSCLEKGYEGIMLRNPESFYKFGRSTLKEGALMKLKRFDDSEAEIIEVVELQRNNNEAKKNALGQTERSSHKANKVGGAIMGAITVKDIKSGVTFDIGTGFTDLDRADFWRLKNELPGLIVKYKHFSGGVKDKPRFPVFLGFRDKIDL